MTLLTICQDAADELNSVRPTAVVNNSMPDVLKLLRYARRVGNDLALRGPWQGLRTAVSFTAVAGEAQAALPADCAKVLPNTFWDVGQRKLVSGPVPGAQWESLTTIGLSGNFRWWTERGNSVLMFPAPAGGETFRFEYQSTAYCQSAGGTAQSRWLADTDTGRISEELITLGVVAMVAESEGLANAQVAKQDYERRFAREVAADLPRDRILATGDVFKGPRHWTGQPAPDNGSFNWPFSS